MAGSVLLNAPKKLLDQVPPVSPRRVLLSGELSSLISLIIKFFRFCVGCALMMSHFIIFNLFIAINIAQVNNRAERIIYEVDLGR
jgi:flagellar biosynthesis component FlhA